MGCILFTEMNPALVNSYRKSEQAIIQGRLLQATPGFANTVFGGVFGYMLLFIKSHMALCLFVAS